MSVIAVVNRKGGCGKTTLATHLAVYCASMGASVLLADVDRQQSTQAWLRRRGSPQMPLAAEIKGRAYPPNTIIRPAKGLDHVIVDTPGGLRGFDLMRVVMYADAVLLPVGVSVFDRESTADCYAEIMALPRVASGRCKVGVVGMRLDPRTNADEVVRTWAAAKQLRFVGNLRDTHTYVRCADRGLTLFDLPAARFPTDRQQWQSIFDWLDEIIESERGAVALGPPTAPFTLPRKPIEANSTSMTDAPAVAHTTAPTPAVRETPTIPAGQHAARPGITSRIGKLMDTLAVPRFLQRN